MIYEETEEGSLSRVTELRGRGMSVKYDKDLDILVIKLRDVDSLDTLQRRGTGGDRDT